MGTHVFADFPPPILDGVVESSHNILIFIIDVVVSSLDKHFDAIKVSSISSFDELLRAVYDSILIPVHGVERVEALSAMGAQVFLHLLLSSSVESRFTISISEIDVVRASFENLLDTLKVIFHRCVQERCKAILDIKLFPGRGVGAGYALETNGSHVFATLLFVVTVHEKLVQSSSLLTKLISNHKIDVVLASIDKPLHTLNICIESQGLHCFVKRIRRVNDIIILPGGRVGPAVLLGTMGAQVFSNLLVLIIDCMVESSVVPKINILKVNVVLTRFHNLREDLKLILRDCIHNCLGTVLDIILLPILRVAHFEALTAHGAQFFAKLLILMANCFVEG